MESVTIDGADFVHIQLKWAATSQAPPHPGFGRWINAPDKKEVVFPNLLMPFVFEEIPEKGPRVRFGLNILYINPIEGLPASRVEGLDLVSLEKAKPKALVITIVRFDINLDPITFVFNVVVENGSTIWKESFSTPELLNEFLRGIKVACQMADIPYTDPEIPTSADGVFVEAKVAV